MKSGGIHRVGVACLLPGYHLGVFAMPTTPRRSNPLRQPGRWRVPHR